ncbi:rrna processing [Pyrenophora seminiperda CCB06]|uniref:Rrna processing n=1 Tax=Pyrenophora seminiperda CCB06 TaxID=1302712 RepID=A0A3M7LXD9_9PLEO|nr:rrna processing [Pyrenophora seminiperda CCB06]
MSESVVIEAPPATETAPVKGMKKNGKQWHDNKAPFRPRANQSSWEKRSADRAALAAVKAKEKELKEEKESERQRRVEAIKSKRAAKEERERFAKMEEKMHKRRVERLKRREKRNKMLKSLCLLNWSNLVPFHMLTYCWLAGVGPPADARELGLGTVQQRLRLPLPSNHDHDMDGQFNLYSPRSAVRVTSDPEKKSQPHKHKHKSSRHHRDRQDGHRHSSSKRHAAKEAMQSAIQIQPPTSFGDLLRQARGSRETSPSHSRRQSVVPKQVDGSASVKEDSTAGITIPPPRPLRSADVKLEAKRVEAREQDLRCALQSLSEQSLQTSRRLDDTYYAILEKVSVLRQTIGTLQELSSLTRELHENFESDTTELVDDVKGQVEAFDSFKTQQEHVSGLADRIRVGREKAHVLIARLAEAQERVDAKAKSEAEWQAQNTHRMRIFWGTVGLLITALFLLFLFHPLQTADVAETPHKQLDSAVRDAILNADIPDIAKAAIIGSTTAKTSPVIDFASAMPTPNGNEPLRKFDEL